MLLNQILPPLHAAMAGRANAQVVEFLLQKSSEAAVWECSPAVGTPLQVGIQSGASLERLQALMHKCGPQRAACTKVATSSPSETVYLLHLALKVGANVEIIHCLAEAWPGALTERDAQGMLPCDHALFYRDHLKPELQKILSIDKQEEEDEEGLSKTDSSSSSSHLQSLFPFW